MNIEPRTRIKRPLFAIAALEKPGFAGFHFFKSNAPGGALRSGKPFVCVNSTGTIKCYSSAEALMRIDNMLKLGWVDKLDPGYNT
jgi:hypothetical protein